MAHSHFNCGIKGARVAGKILLGICAAVVFALIFGFAVMYLWNWLMPGLFGLGVITYFQAFGLVVLAKILFGSFGHGHRYDRGEYKLKMKLHGKGEKGSDDAVPEEIRGNREEFESFWEKEGRNSFEEYMKRINGKD